MTQATLNPLTLPLKGQQLIEASAGTGKTWTLAAIYLRLILGHKQVIDDGTRVLLPPDILVMTFTEAATAELKERILTRLEEALIAFKTQSTNDIFLSALLADFDVTTYPHCIQRLTLAIEWMDEAAIFTIHGWASRMLRQHALASLSIFEQTLVEDSYALRLAAAKHYWRCHYYALNKDEVVAVQRIATTPEALLEKLPLLTNLPETSTTTTTAHTSSPKNVIAPWLAWQNRLSEIQEQIKTQWFNGGVSILCDALAKKVLNGRSYSLQKIESISNWLNQSADTPKVAVLTLFSTGNFNINKGQFAPEHPAFDAILAYVNHIAIEPNYEAELLAHAQAEIAQLYQQRKAQAGMFDFDDLLHNLYHALNNDTGTTLADTIRTQYPVALVDEFQDTDAWQYGCLSPLYADRDDTLLIMIGDPKQAIYRFRGADIHTYLRARNHAKARHTLTKNFRSSQEVINVINALFMKAETYPQGAFQFKTAVELDNPVPFIEVSAGKDLSAFMRTATEKQPALTLWALSPETTVTKSRYLEVMAEQCASEIVSLLNNQTTGFVDSVGNKNTCQASDIAILVRGTGEAQVMKKALSARRLPSVYLSDKESVFTSDEALDVWHLLNAVNEPESQQKLAAALACKSFAVPFSLLDTLVDNEAAWDAWIVRFYSWKTTWQQQGVLAMIYRIIHEQGIANYWLQQQEGERKLTNLLHITESLQQASQQQEGNAALIRWLTQQITQQPLKTSKSHLIRLESDAACIKIITIHKSKGLEYPLVFIPFAMTIGVNKYHEATSEAAQQQALQESIRLLYVALTRASHALWLGVAAMKSSHNSSGFHETALGYLLNGGIPVQETAWSRCFDAWRQQIGNACAWQTELTITNDGYQPAMKAQHQAGVLVAKKRTWPLSRVSSYSGMTQQLQMLEKASDIADPLWFETVIDIKNAEENSMNMLLTATEVQETPWHHLPAGAHVGTLLHNTLEWQIIHSWPDKDAQTWLETWHQYYQQSGLELIHLPTFESWIQTIANHPLPVTTPITLNQLSRDNAWPEMAFWMPISQTNTQAIDLCVRHAVLPEKARPALSAQALGGLVTGFMDLIFIHNGRYYVLDYKTNKLTQGYDNNACEASILAHRYDVQAMLYILALHRLLQQRLPDYHYDTHMGGAIYWYLRGVDQQNPQQGFWQCLPSIEAIESLAILFSNTEPESC